LSKKIEPYYSFYEYEKIAVFIDGANLYSSAKALGFDIDYEQLLCWLSSQSRLVRAFYYTSLIEEQDYSPVRPLVDWLNYNGYTTVTKPAREYTDSHGIKKIKSDMGIDIAVDAMEISDKVDHIVIFSGDGSFKRLIESIQKKGVRVTSISTIQTNPSMMSDDLRKQTDNFIDLYEIKDLIQKYNSNSSAVS